LIGAKARKGDGDQNKKESKAKQSKEGEKGVGRDGTEVGLGWSPVILSSSIIDSLRP
jgi:hypothetical protein